MTEVTEEARKELDVIRMALKEYTGLNLSEGSGRALMLALDKHHGRTPPDPYVAKAERLLRAIGLHNPASEYVAFLVQLHKEFPDG